MRIIMFLTTACILFFTLSFVYAEESLSAHNAWVPEAPPGMKVMAAYVIIKNDTGDTDDLIDVSSSHFGRVEMHRTIIENDQARMVKQDRIAIKPGEAIKFEPGGSHLMLFNPKENLKKGDEIDLNFVFNRGSTLTVKAQVRKHSEMHSMEHNN